MITRNKAKEMMTKNECKLPLEKVNVNLLVDKIFDSFQIEKEEFANQLTRNIYDCKDHHIKRNVHKTIGEFLTNKEMK